MKLLTHNSRPNFAPVYKDVNRRAEFLEAEVRKEKGGDQVTLSDNLEVSLQLLDDISDRLNERNVVEGKRFMRHGTWLTRVALEGEGEAGFAVRTALEDLRNSCLDITFVKQLRKYPHRHFEVTARPEPSDLPNYERVTENFHRGGQPDQAGVDWLKSQGIKTIIDLRGGDRDNQWSPVDTSGLQRHDIDVPDFQPPTFEQVQKAISILDDPEAHPVFLHCKAGVGRTGTVTACWRVAHGLSAEEALKTERINSYHGSLRQEQFVRDFESYLREQNTRTEEPAPPRSEGEDKDPWSLLHAFSDVTKGLGAAKAGRLRQLDAADQHTLEEFSAFWSDEIDSQN